MSSEESKLKKAIKFIRYDIWNMSLDGLPKSQYFLIRQLRVVMLAIRGFNEDKCMLQASALTFYSLLSIVPIIAMAFGIAQGFGFQKMLDKELEEMFGAQKEVLHQATSFAHSMLENTKGGLVAGIGVAILIWTVMKVLGNIEASFNDIWQIKKSRSWLRKFTDYLSIMLLAPLLLVLSSSITVFINTSLTALVEKVDYSGFMVSMVNFLFGFSPYFLMWVLFTFLYIVMPNTTVKIRSAIIAGIIAGTIYKITEWGFVSFEIGVAQYNRIYGSFAALPLFLFFMQTAWLIVLFGAEIAFAEQNVGRYEFELESKLISNNYRGMLTLWVMHLLVKNFEVGGKAMTANEISEKLRLPMRVLNKTLHDLHLAGGVSEVKTENEKELAYQPALDINKITVKRVVDMINETGINDLPVTKNESYKKIDQVFHQLQEHTAKAKENVLLINI